MKAYWKGMIERRVNKEQTKRGTGGFGLTQMGESEMFEKVLSGD